MNRLVRISLTLLASALLMLVLVEMRLNDAKNMTEAARQKELTMGYVGFGIALLLFVSGVGVLTKFFVSRRKARAALHG